MLSCIGWYLLAISTFAIHILSIAVEGEGGLSHAYDTRQSGLSKCCSSAARRTAPSTFTHAWVNVAVARPDKPHPQLLLMLESWVNVAAARPDEPHPQLLLTTQQGRMSCNILIIICHYLWVNVHIAILNFIETECVVYEMMMLAYLLQQRQQ